MICQKCQQEFPSRIKIEGRTHSLQNRKYCLTCSPYGEHNTKTLNSGPLTEAWCPKCLETRPVSEFYMRRNGKNTSPYCKKHTNLETLERGKKFKRLCAEYKGGRCCKCGYDKCLSALHFHHRDPTEKDSTISELKSKKFESAKQELDKCDLLCANCHAETHEKF